MFDRALKIHNPYNWIFRHPHFVLRIARKWERENVGEREHGWEIGPKWKEHK